MGYPKFRHQYTIGDLRPDLVGALPYDLTGSTVTLYVRRPDATLLTKVATIVDAYDAATGLGTFKIVWDAGDLQVGLNQVCQVKDSVSARPQSWPIFLLDVIDGPQTV